VDRSVSADGFFFLLVFFFSFLAVRTPASWDDALPDAATGAAVSSASTDAWGSSSFLRFLLT